METSEIITLYHGSKEGINGIIKPISRQFCDFGRGFYMGTEKLQPLTLICNYPKSKIYEVELDLTNLNVLHIEIGLDWALLIAFNRGKMERIKDTKIYNKYKEMLYDYDVITGYIANDRMFIVLERFFLGEITDIALINSLSALKLGKQYVAITEKACNNITIIGESFIVEEERTQLKLESEKNREEGIKKSEEICRQYRREGKFFDEIIGEVE